LTVSFLLPPARVEEGDEIGVGMADTQSPAPPVAQSRTASISNHVVHVMSDYTGRGPTKARTTIDGDLVSVLMRDTLTKGERSLVADGRVQLVLDTRKAFQMTMREDLVAGVERIMGREVIAFLSDNHVDPDFAIEAFVLAPVADDGRQSEQ
jgi:uncharacterized protein YbcI